MHMELNLTGEFWKHGLVSAETCRSGKLVCDLLYTKVG